MFVAGFIVTIFISLVSFAALFTLTSPQAGPIVIGLFFLTIFTSLASIAILCHFLIVRLRGTSVHWNVMFRRGILLGGFVTFFLVCEAMRVFTPLGGLSLALFFGGIEALSVRRERLSAE